VERVKTLYLHDDWESFKKLRISQIQSRTPVKQRIERTDGKIIDCATVPLPDGATLINYIDLTDSMMVERSLRERNEALQQADHLKTEFLANVSYELRSPLTTISGFSDMLRQQYFGTLTDKQKDYVEGIHSSSEHLMQLVNDILDLASIEAGFMQLSAATFDIAAMMKSVLALVQERAKKHLVTIVLQIKPNIGRMLADETRIKQCLFNLISNAIRFSNPGGQIILAAETVEPDDIRMYVQDDGPGIPAEEQPFVFDKFTKGSNRNIPKSKSKAGTGLGLSIVKSFIELHGGKVELESNPDEFTRFSCTLPRSNEALKGKV
jgi:signal transduction histidine kinase